jgi:predicted RNA-binding Zn ribbon-like protein
MSRVDEPDSVSTGAGCPLPELRAAPLRLPGLVGGALCLDFSNTVDNRLGDRPRDRFGGYDDILTWAEYAGALTPDEAAMLRTVAGDAPAASEAAFGRARLARELIYRVVAAVAGGEAPAAADRVALERAYLDALAHASLQPVDGAYRWTWPVPGGSGTPTDAADALDRPLWPIVASAVDLLTTGDLRRVKRCASTVGCSWLFVDTSKNATRRWCSMEYCGSQAKMRRHYARRRAAARR